MTISPGSRLGPYEVLSPLGAGGMGEVYRARDPRLGRDVAVKVLPASTSQDPDRLRRFEQEAKAAGLLNHPNITAVYDIGSHEGAPYVVQELLEGETLRNRLAGGAFTPRRAIGHALQIAQGLAAAHEKAIVHRDLKPENIFVTSDGRVKILDFGLAKLTQPEKANASQTNLPTMTPGTEAGMVLGTLGYMSPEQVRGKPADARSDIFSFGAILYEMLSGRRAFHADTAADTISAILTRDPPDLSETNRRIPEALDRIVRHCLEKSPEARFHSASDIAFDLEAISGTSLVSAAGTAPGAVPWSARARSALPWLALPLALLGYLAGRLAAPKNAAVPQAMQAEVRKLTIQPGVESYPSLSPDAAAFVYEAGPPGNSDIFLQRSGGHNPINLTKDCDKDDNEPAFSPSGDRIAFRSECGGGGIFLMGATGENVRRLSDFGFNPAWSPDEKEIAVSAEGIVDPYSRQGVADLWAIQVATGQKRAVVRGFDCAQPSWSPHGDRIACWGLRANAGQRDVWTVPARGETSAGGVDVTNDAATDWNPFWSPDGRFLYFASDRGGTMNLWKVVIEEKSGRTLAESEPMTLPASWSGPLSLSRDGKHIAFEVKTSLPSIERIAFDPVGEKVIGEPATVFRGSLPVLAFEVSPDGQWVAFSSSGRQQDLFLIRSDGTGLRQLTDDPPRDRGLGWSRDGQRVYFMSDRSGRYDIWAIRPDGSGLVQVTKNAGAGPFWPVFSPDGSMFAFPDGTKSYLFRLRKVPGEGDVEPLTQLAEDRRFEVRDWSPDGKRLSGTGRLFGGGCCDQVVLYSSADRKYERLTESGSNPRFLPDGRRLLYLTESSLWLIDSVSKKKQVILPSRHDSGLLDFGLSSDGRALYIQRDLQESDIWEATLK
ncbi:MAG: protein kinase domain-containing protein [Thermoanaerobaculia bacterium]